MLYAINNVLIYYPGGKVIRKSVTMTMKLRIDGYSFGRMTVGGKEFTSDLIIHRDGRIQDRWWRAQGHNLLPDDITSVLDAGPEKLVIGTGAMGMMSVSESVLDLCEKRVIEVEVYRTAEAVKRFNKAVVAGTTVAACFHLTC
ncbi:MAG: hypothetical protein IMY71_00885 [Bacteroidetes bacterium]|nr:hypothetical protein [Bacteroidota bacterium]